MIADLIKKNRSFRRFDQTHRIDLNTLSELVDLGRLGASAANLQPLRYILSCNPVVNERVFECLAWAAYLKSWPGPAPGEHPTAYITMVCGPEHAKWAATDMGIAAQNILLGATEKGLGGCMLGAIKRKALRQVLQIPSEYDILLVLALGKPKETVVIESIPRDAGIEYWRDADDVHHVPKRRLEDIILATHD